MPPQQPCEPWSNAVGSNALSGSSDGSPRLDLHLRVRQLTKHFRRVHRLDSGRRHLKLPRIVEAHGVFDGPVPFGDELVVSAKAIEPPLLKSEPRPTAPPLPARQQPRLPSKPAPQNGSPGRDRVIDHHPGHIRLRVELEMHPRHIASRPDSRSPLLDWRDRAGNPESTRERLMQWDRRHGAHHRPGRSGPPVPNVEELPAFLPRQLGNRCSLGAWPAHYAQLGAVADPRRTCNWSGFELRRELLHGKHTP